MTNDQNNVIDTNVAIRNDELPLCKNPACKWPFLKLSNRQQYCDPSCRSREHKLKHKRPWQKMRDCARERCKNRFMMRAVNHQYCSSKCEKLVYYGEETRHKKILRCITCWREFFAYHGNLHYCSDNCRVIGVSAAKIRCLPAINNTPEFYGFWPRDKFEFRLWFRESYLLMGFQSIAGVFPCFDADEFNGDKERFHTIACYQCKYGTVARSIWEYTNLMPRVYQLSPWVVLYRKYLDGIDSVGIDRVE